MPHAQYKSQVRRRNFTVFYFIPAVDKWFKPVVESIMVHLLRQKVDHTARRLYALTKSGSNIERTRHLNALTKKKSIKIKHDDVYALTKMSKSTTFLPLPSPFLPLPLHFLPFLPLQRPEMKRFLFFQSNIGMMVFQANIGMAFQPVPPAVKSPF